MTQPSVEPRTTAEDAGEGTRVPAGRSWLDRYFHISRRGSTVAREVRGGVTTFMAMAYILLLNPLILSGKDVAGDTLAQQGLITATAFAAALTTLLMGFVGKVPLALAAGLSVSGVLASQVAPEMTWPQAMGMCVMYGVIIMLLVVTGLREMIMNAIPLALKHGITMGIGLFIALIGFYKSGFVHQGGDSRHARTGGRTGGWPVLLFAGTLLLIFMLQARNIPGAILIGIVGGTIVAAILNAAGVVDPKQWAAGAPNCTAARCRCPTSRSSGTWSWVAGARSAR